jgi:hypothetical protein
LQVSRSRGQLNVTDVWCAAFQSAESGLRMNVVDPILFQCKLNPAAAAICVPGTKFNVVSYARLAQLIHNVSRMALSHGLSKGDIVAIAVAIRFGMPH